MSDNSPETAKNSGEVAAATDGKQIVTMAEEGAWQAAMIGKSGGPWSGTTLEALIDQYANGIYIGKISKPPLSVCVEHLHEFATKLLALATPARAEQNSGDVVAWMHTLHMEGGQERVLFSSFEEKHPFGRAGIDYSPTYTVTSVALVTATDVATPANSRAEVIGAVVGEVECIRCGAIEYLPKGEITCSICVDAIQKGTEPNGADRTGMIINAKEGR